MPSVASFMQFTARVTRHSRTMVASDPYAIMLGSRSRVSKTWILIFEVCRQVPFLHIQRIGLTAVFYQIIALLSALITRHPQSRPDPTTLPSYAFFSSLPISTLNFLDRSTFASKSREEKVAFMKGLAGVLPRFSDGLRTRKILPSLVEEVRTTSIRD